MNKFNWNYPTTMWVGENRVKDLPSACKNLNIQKPLLVTDNGLSKSLLISNILKLIQEQNISVEVFSNVIGNPTGTNVVEGVDFFKKK